MIRSENILKVINNFKKVLPMATVKNHLDMMECEVNNGHTCGTIHCHGGWYAIAACDLSYEMNYMSGSNNMARTLGFGRDTDLERWAQQNTSLWGNNEGACMFCDEEAFYHKTKRPEGAKTLQHIVDHWQEVYERVKAIELTTEPPVDTLIDNALIPEKTLQPI